MLSHVREVSGKKEIKMFVGAEILVCEDELYVCIVYAYK